MGFPFVSSRGRRQLLAGGVVTAIGLLLFGPPVYDIWDDVAELDWSIFTTVAENAAFLLLASGVTAGGVWLLQADWDPRHATDVARWTVFGFGSAVVLFGWVVFTQLWVMNRLKPVVIAMDGIVIVSSIAFGLGLMSAKSNIKHLKLQHEQRVNESLKSLQRTVFDLQATTEPEAAYDVGLDGVDEMFSPAVVRLVIDGEAVRRRTDDASPEERLPTRTVEVGERGRLEVGGREFTEADEKALELLGTHLDRALSRIERERNLEHERERLELVNRILRHNLLNSLNVVHARTELLDEHVDPEADAHLETVRERTTDMIRLVEKLRTLMVTLVESGETEFEEVDLGAILRAEVRQAERRFEGATFELEDDPDDAGTVVADELLGEVFENLLVNAVQHNDKDTPRVRVAVERGAEMTTVRIADNGPGISPGLRSQLFQRGETHFDSAGTGFGLSLAQEVVEAYGGSISVDDSELGGAEFSVSLPSRDAADGTDREPLESAG